MKISSIEEKEALKDNIKFQFINWDYLDRSFIKIKEIKDKRILGLYYDFFEILDIKTKKRICKIEGKFEKEEKYNDRYYDNIFFDFNELKNKDLIIWSKGKIFYYKKCDNKYELSQVINEVTQQMNRTKICQIGCTDIYDLYN